MKDCTALFLSSICPQSLFFVIVSLFSLCYFLHLKKQLKTIQATPVLTYRKKMDKQRPPSFPFCVGKCSWHHISELKIHASGNFYLKRLAGCVSCLNYWYILKKRIVFLMTFIKKSKTFVMRGVRISIDSKGFVHLCFIFQKANVKFKTLMENHP